MFRSILTPSSLKAGKRSLEKRWPAGGGGGADGQVGDAAVSERGKKKHALAPGIGPSSSSKAKQARCRKQGRRVGGRWRVGAPRRAIGRSTPIPTTFQPRSRLLVHRSGPRTAAPGARFAANGRRRRTTATGRNHSFLATLGTSSSAVRPTSPCSMAFLPLGMSQKQFQSKRDLGLFLFSHTVIQIPSSPLLLLSAPPHGARSQ